MSISSKFNFDNLWSEKSTDADRIITEHAKYDFAVAYPPYEAVPMYGLIDGLKSKVDADLEKVSSKLNLNFKTFSTVAQAMSKAQLIAGSDDLIYVGGSTFVVAEIL